MFNYSDKHILITGGAKGIGREIARQFLVAGGQVSLVDRDEAALQQTVLDLAQGDQQIKGFVADISDQQEVEDTIRQVEQQAPIDVVINNAGICPIKSFMEIDADTWQQTLDVNLSGTFYVCQAVARYMIPRKRGVILNMSSKNGLDAELGHAHYNASKAGVILLTKTIAIELAHLGIRANAICPGYIRTPLNYEVDSPEFVQQFAERYVPIERVGKVQEIAPIFLFLASEGATYINGQTFVLDGGQLAGQKPWPTLLKAMYPSAPK
ncbi:MAG: SDR family oxidoreductase [Saprospiraceae bacterium]|nr:SDR family oxidoreductase [Saprospiraceae bacterium]